MPEFVVELYASRERPSDVDDYTRRARHSAEDMAREGSDIRLVRSLFLPDDETCFLLYEAESADVVLAALQLAELPPDRVAEAVASPAADAHE